MEATANMNDGKECDLLFRLAKEKDFGLNESELNGLLDAKLYIGRCVEQVEQFVNKTRGALVGLQREKVEINL